MFKDKITRGLLIALAAVFVFSAAIYFAKTPACRYVFRFQSVDSGKSAIEYRMLPYKRGDEKIVQYVDELLLGPKTERSRPIFSPGTRASFCFVRSHILYVNLGSELLYQSGNAGDIMEGLELFKRNIFKTFPSIKKIEVFIDGNRVLKENAKI